MLGEASADSNRAFGMSLLAFGWGLGLIFGSTIAGFTSDPLNQYNISVSSQCSLHLFVMIVAVSCTDDIVREGLLRFPFFPPFLILSLMCLFSALLAMVWLPETLKKRFNNSTILHTCTCIVTSYTVRSTTPAQLLSSETTDLQSLVEESAEQEVEDVRRNKLKHYKSLALKTLNTLRELAR